MSKKTDDQQEQLRKQQEEELARAQAQAIVEKELALQSQQQSETFLGTVRAEHTELGDRLGKLTSFIGSIDFAAVDQEERERLKGQEIAMMHYHGILAARIAYHEARGEK